MLAVERRNLILETLQEEKRVVVSELSQIYRVSEETIRRDLDKLDRDGLATKSYGGAVLNENTNIDMPFNVRRKHNVSGKQKVAELAATLIHDGDRIMLDASTTAIFIAKAIKHKERLTVITNSIEIVIELSDLTDWDVIMTGGSAKAGYLALLGPKTIDNVNSYNVDLSFVSCKGLEEQKGFTDSNEQLAQVKQAMLRAAKSGVLVVDGSKFGKIAFSKVGELKEITTVVTDRKPDKKWMTLFEQKGVQCLYPEE